MMMIKKELLMLLQRLKVELTILLLEGQSKMLKIDMKQQVIYKRLSKKHLNQYNFGFLSRVTQLVRVSP